MLAPLRLRTRFNIAAWYDRVRASGTPVAWCSAFAPAEVLLACGVMPVYPENHAAMLGALSPTKDLNAPWSAPAIATAEAAGMQQPQLCSYAQADIGVLLGAGSPIQGLPEPALFYACDSQCSVVERWGNRVQQLEASRGRDIPHFVLHAPPLRGDRHPPEQLARFASDLRNHAQTICTHFGTKFDEDHLAMIVAESSEANRLWQACLELARRRPAPWTSIDAFQAMAPIVIARGDPLCTAYYRELLQELEERVSTGQAAVADEQVRLMWDAIPIWPRKNWLGQLAASHHAAFVTSTYTHSWWFHFDSSRAFDSLVERYAWNTMNRTGKWVLDWTLDLVKNYQVDGIICHWNRSCGIWNSFVKRRLPGYVAAAVPHLVIEADMVDPRCFDEKRIGEQISAFIATLPQPQPPLQAAP